MDKKVLVDIGGTNIEIKIIEKNKTIFKTFKVDSLNKDQVLDKISEIVNALNWQKVNLNISSPTAVDLNTGFCKGISGIKDYANFNLYKELDKRINSKEVQIKALNDANCAMLGIINTNFKEKPQSAILFALGTGIGGSVYLNKQIYSGIDNMAGEFGYPFWSESKNVSLSLSPVNVFKEINPLLTGRQILNDYEKDTKTKEKINQWIKNLVKFMNFYVFGLNPEYIFFSGGVSQNKLFKELVQKEYESSLETLKVTNLIKTKIKFFNDEEINYSLEGANFI